MKRIKRLQKMPIVGSFVADKYIFDLANEILHDPTEPMQNKLLALRKIDEAIGESGTYSEGDVEEYCRVSCA